MKAFILEDGAMHVEAESALEAYALRKWCQENISGTFPVRFDYSFVSQGAHIASLTKRADGEKT